MEMKGALTLPRDEFWYDTAVALMKGKEEEILAEKGDRQILDVIKDAKEARDKKCKETKCFSCGNFFEAESWHEPPQCPWCHGSRVD